MKPGQKIQLGLAVALAALFAAGCSTTSSTRARALKPTLHNQTDLARYRIASVVPFDVAPGRQIDRSVGVRFSEDVATRLQYDFGALFQEVRKGAATAREEELIVTGIIHSYRPGSRTGRFMFNAFETASFKGELILKNAKDGAIVYRAPFDKLWAWGGVMGATKGMEDMVAESAAAVAHTVAHARGWKPEPDLARK